MLQIRIQEVLISNLTKDTGFPEWNFHDVL
jgi:hypothetical protein